MKLPIRKIILIILQVANAVQQGHAQSTEVVKGKETGELGSSTFNDRYYDLQTFLEVNGSYAFTSKWRAFFEVNNLTNRPLRYFQGIPQRLMQEEFYNVRANFGVKFDLFGDQ